MVFPVNFVGKGSHWTSKLGSLANLCCLCLASAGVTYSHHHVQHFIFPTWELRIKLRFLCLSGKSLLTELSPQPQSVILTLWGQLCQKWYFCVFYQHLFDNLPSLHYCWHTDFLYLITDLAIMTANSWLWLLLNLFTNRMILKHLVKKMPFFWKL